MAKYVNGFSLIEVMVSLFLITIIFLSVQAMKIASLNNIQASYFYSLAHQQIKNGMAFLNAQADLEKWKLETRQVLPNGRGNIETHAADIVVSVMWGIYKSDTCVEDKIAVSGCAHEIYRLYSH